MKNEASIHFPLTSQVGFFIVLLVLSISSCTERSVGALTHAEQRIKHRTEFLSESYNHFEGGVLFTDVEFGLDVLWKASFKHGYPYKENLGFFVPGGLLISPNRENTLNRGKLNMFPNQIKDGKLLIFYNNAYVEVLGIVHTHPDPYCLPSPTPGNDYQFCYLGIHNYIMDNQNLFDAYKDLNGLESYVQLGTRTAYWRIPFLFFNNFYADQEQSENKK